MWERAWEVLEHVERIQRRMFELRSSRYSRPIWEPPVDIFKTDEDLWVLVALPGVAPEKLEVLIEEGALVVRGERSLPPECRHASVHRLEIPHGWFEREIELPPGRFRITLQECRHGCLFVSLKHSE